MRTIEAGHRLSETLMGETSRMEPEDRRITDREHMEQVRTRLEEDEYGIQQNGAAVRR